MRLDLVLATLALAGAILVGVVILVLAKRWRQEAWDSPEPGAEDATFRELYEQGLLDSEEFERIRQRLAGGGSAEAQPEDRKGPAASDRET